MLYNVRSSVFMLFLASFHSSHYLEAQWCPCGLDLTKHGESSKEQDISGLVWVEDPEQDTPVTHALHTYKFSRKARKESRMQMFECDSSGFKQTFLNLMKQIILEKHRQAGE